MPKQSFLPNDLIVKSNHTREGSSDLLNFLFEWPLYLMAIQEPLLAVCRDTCKFIQIFRKVKRLDMQSKKLTLIKSVDAKQITATILK